MEREAEEVEPITEGELTRLVLDPATSAWALDAYTELAAVEGAGAFMLERRPIVGLVVPSAPGAPSTDALGVSIAGAGGIVGWLNGLEHRLRRAHYRRQKRRGKPRIVSEGDSWFQHPVLQDIIDHLQDDHAVFSLGEAGAELADMATGAQLHDTVQAVRQEAPGYFLLSGGGNDTVGDQLPDSLKKASEVDPAGPFALRFLDEPKLHTKLDEITLHMQTLVSAVLDADDHVRVVLHGYSYPAPVPFGQVDHPRVTGPGIKPWLSSALDAAGVREDTERRSILRIILDRFHERLVALASTLGPRVRLVDLRRVLEHDDPEHFWDDELHPTPSGSRLLAERIALEMRTWEFTFADALASPGPLGLSALAVLDVIDSFEEFERRCNEERPTRALASPHIMEGTLVEELTWGQRLLGVPAVWALTQGEGVTVAVLDTGCDVAHPDLSGALIDSRDFTGQGGRDDNPVWDAHGHGTHCAGIVGARRNDMGFVGVAPACSLLIAKVLGDDGTGDPDAVAAGIRWAVAQGADVLSISLGGPRKTPALYRAVHAALLEGVMVICAAGNAGSTVSNAIGYPGRYGSVVCVGAHDEHGQPSGFSSRGGELDVLAPGERVWSTYPGGRWAKLSGTSMAAPFVAGLAALIVAKHKRAGSNATPLRNTEDLKRHLTWMATHPGHHNPTSGYGALQPFLGVSAPSAW